MPLDPTIVAAEVDRCWDEGIVDTLCEYIAIPNVSPAFDPEWDANGHMARAVDLLTDWCRARAIEGMTVEVHHLEGRTPLIHCEIPPTPGCTRTDTVLLYGHLDKQPEMTGWRDGLGPWTPVIAGDRLYGRGGADDGYAVFAALTAIEAIHAAGGDHARCVVLIEASEESGSSDLPVHLEAIGGQLGDVSLVIGLDSGTATYDRFWITTSLRGVIVADVRVDVLTEGVHSGNAGGVVPSSARILRRLLDRIEDADTGAVLLPGFWAEVPAERTTQIAETADHLVGEMVFPWAGSTNPGDRSAEDLVRARTWEPTVSTIAMDGFPPADRAGNVLRPFTTATLSCRLAPTADPEAAAAELAQTLTADPPHGATVTVTVRGAEGGWNAPPTEAWLQAAVDEASEAHWGPASRAMGEGGTIPFMGMLGHQFPDAQFLICGVLGPESNAHGPNEFLHLPMARRITAAVAHVVDAHTHR